MKRLTETNNCIGFMETYLNVDCKECQYKDTSECEEFKDECKAVADFKNFVKNMYSKLKEYEDLEEQGKLLKLHFAVCDTVYTLNSLPSGKTVIGETTADAFMCALGMLEGRFGKTIFLTLKEAEVALKELERRIRENE